MKRILCLAAIAAVILAACQTPPKMKETPGAPLSDAEAPPRKIILHEKITWGDGVFLKKVVVHPGEFFYSSTDKKGHYYLREGGVSVWDTVETNRQGGIFWKTGDEEPLHVFWMPILTAKPLTLKRKDGLDFEFVEE